MSLFFDIPESWEHDPLAEDWAHSHGQRISDPTRSHSVFNFILGRKARFSDAQSDSSEFATQVAEVMELDASVPLPVTV